jgi:3'-phosphoadenosine 5'-phosphosulfate (PAPS) 3'-phosphatase
VGFPGLGVVIAAAGAAGGGGAGQGWAATREGDAGGAAAGVGAAASLAAGSAQRSPTLPLPELAVFVDPLDATQEYSEGLWEYVTVSACLTRCGVPIAGLIYQPFQQRLYWTRPGTAVNVAFSADGAVEAERALPHTWEEGGQTGGQCCRQRRQQQQPWSALDANATAGLRLVMSRSHSQKGSTAAILASLPPDATATPAGGAGYKFIQVLEGSADAYLHPGGSRKWDVCAGEALLLAAGGSVSQWGGGATDYCLPPLPPAQLGGQAARQQAMDSAVRIAGLVAAKSGQLGQALVGLLGGSSGVPAAQVQ